MYATKIAFFNPDPNFDPDPKQVLASALFRIGVDSSQGLLQGARERLWVDSGSFLVALLLGAIRIYQQLT